MLSRTWEVYFLETHYESQVDFIGNQTFGPHSTLTMTITRSMSTPFPNMDKNAEGLPPNDGGQSAELLLGKEAGCNRSVDYALIQDWV